MKPLVVCYHAVSPDWDHYLSVPSDQLVRQVRRLQRLAAVHVTFDDAYRNIEPTIPPLQELGVAITVFVCTSLADAGGAAFEVAEIDVSTDEDRSRLMTLDWDGLRTLAESGVGIGSHTVTHPHLCDLDDDQIRSELVTSKRRIEEETGLPCRELAYPYGEHNERVRRQAKDAGYERAYGLIDADTKHIKGARTAAGDPHGRPRLLLHRGDGVLRTFLKGLTLELRAPKTR